MNPQFTIIVPVYNTEKYLKKCVDSLLAQTLEEIEIILVDDGSADQSGKICDGYCDGKKVKVIHKKNEGQGIARNAGLEIAEGEYVLFIDSDDFIEKNTCQELYRYMKDNALQLCSFGYVIEDGEGREIYCSKLKERIFRDEEIKEAFVLHFFGDSPTEDELRGVSACMTAFDRKIIEEYKVRFPSERKVLSEDTIFNLEFCRHIDRAAVLPAYFYHYFQNAQSFSHSYRSDRFEKTKLLCGILEGYAEKYGIKKKVELRIRMQLWVSLMECIKQEVRREDADKKTVRVNVKGMCADARTQQAVWKLNPADFGIKQKALLWMVRKKWTAAVIFMAQLRNAKGL